jgi:membrane protease YdiL (CAAX protease family)
MNAMFTLIRRRPLITFFALAYAITWALVPLFSVSFVFPVLGLFGPALAAVIVTALTDGRAAVRTLLGRVVQWRVGWIWYLIALGLPFALTLAAQGLHRVLGGSVAAGPGDPIALIATLAILVVGEELGWRGYALPRLQTRFGGMGASLILGALWAVWHLMNAAIPGLERYWYAFPAFALFVVAQTVLFTWISNHARGSVLIAWLFHAAINASGSQLAIGDPVRQWWLSGAVFGVVALVVLAWAGPNLARRPELPTEPGVVAPEGRRL